MTSFLAGSFSALFSMPDTVWIRNDELNSFLPTRSVPEAAIDTEPSVSLRTAILSADDATKPALRMGYLGRWTIQVSDIALRFHVVHGQRGVVPKPMTACRPTQGLVLGALRICTAYATTTGDLYVPIRFAVFTTTALLVV